MNNSISKTLEAIENNRHPMDKAIERNDIEFVKNNLDINDEIILYHAVRHGNTAIFEYIFPLFNLASQRKALWSIAGKNRFDYLEFALKYITIDKNDSRPHELACCFGHLDMLKYLEKLGVPKGEYSFHSAFESKSLDVIEYLYDGEDFSQYLKNQTEIIPLDLLKFIMSKSELSEDKKHRVLLGAAYVGYIDVIEYLLSMPIPTNSEGALFESVYFGSELPTMKYLLTQAPVLSDISENDYFAFIWAYQKHYEDFVDYLVNEHNISPETSPDILYVMKTDNFALYNKVLKVQKS